MEAVTSQPRMELIDFFSASCTDVGFAASSSGKIGREGRGDPLIFKFWFLGSF